MWGASGRPPGRGSPITAAGATLLQAGIAPAHVLLVEGGERGRHSRLVDDRDYQTINRNGELHVAPLASEEHATRLGKLVNNLQTLELWLRYCLTKKHNRPMPDLLNSKVGDEVLVTPLTDYRQLRALISDYNAQVRVELRIDPGVADLRDTLAHGRIVGPANNPVPLRLFKFSNPNGAAVTRVTHAATLTPEWFEAQGRLVHEQAVRLQMALKEIGEELKLKL
jgi:hypothetical protein